MTFVTTISYFFCFFFIDLFCMMEKNTTAAYIVAGIGCGMCIGWFLRSRMKSACTNCLKQSVSNRPNDIKYFSDSHGDMKFVIVVRQDLKMGKGKIAAQCSHAAVAAYKQLSKRKPDLLKEWESAGQTKVVVKCTTEEELLALYDHARILELTTSLIHDAGRTQIMSGSRTVLGVGPGREELVNKVTGHLKLL